MIKAIVFDFSGVLATEGYSLWLKENLTDFEVHREYFHKLTDPVDKGDLSEDDFLDVLAEKTGIEKGLIKQAIFDRIVVDPKMVEFMSQLKKQYKVALLSNFQPQWLTEILIRDDLNKHFDDIIISGHVKLIKPQPEIFQLLIDRLGIGKHEVVFIDDREINVQGAQEFGIDAILFTSIEELKKELQKKGVHIS